MAYTQKVMDHFTSPRNMGEIADADGLGKVGNPTCGDMMYIYIKVKNDVITEIKFKTLGCAAAIATSSMVTELAKGMTLKQGLALTRKDVADALEGLPPQKMHCSNLAADGLHDAIRDYLVRNGRESEAPPKIEHDHDDHSCETDAPIQIH